MSLFFISALLVGCQSSPKKTERKDFLHGQIVDALCSIEGLPVAESNAIYIKSQNGFYLLKTEEGFVISLPVNSCVLQFHGTLKNPTVKPSRSVDFPI